MRKSLAAALAALTFGGAVLASAAPAQAEHNRYYRGHRDGDDTAAAAIIAGIAGLAIGAAIASKDDDRDRYDDGYRRRDRYGYRNNYGVGYGYDPHSDRYYRHHRHGYDGYWDRNRTCVTRERVWDSYEDRYVRVERRYPC